MRKKILIIIGTRPEAIKMCPLLKEFKRFDNKFDTRLCATAQHREMLDQVLNFFDVKIDYDLDLMKDNQNLLDLAGGIFKSIRTVFEDFQPDYVFVHGDTTTTMVGSIAAFYSGAQICHVEAGLRTNKKRVPFPEEINRRLTSVVTDYHFAPTTSSKENLIEENVPESSIIVTGNTVIDALMETMHRVVEFPSSLINHLFAEIGDREVVLVTGHRRENHGVGFERICNAIKRIAAEDKERVIIYPVHFNPNVQEPVNRILSNISNIILIDPLSYPDFVALMNKSKIIITDSGGIQEEAPSLGIPVLVMRDSTERPEAVEAGTVVLVGSNEDLIVETALRLLNDEDEFHKMSKRHNPYGDGKACERIVKFISEL